MLLWFDVLLICLCSVCLPSLLWWSSTTSLFVFDGNLPLSVLRCLLVGCGVQPITFWHPWLAYSLLTLAILGRQLAVRNRLVLAITEDTAQFHSAGLSHVITDILMCSCSALCFV